MCPWAAAATLQLFITVIWSFLEVFLKLRRNWMTATFLTLRQECGLNFAHPRWKATYPTLRTPLTWKRQREMNHRMRLWAKPINLTLFKSKRLKKLRWKSPRQLSHQERLISLSILSLQPQWLWSRVSSWSSPTRSSRATGTSLRRKRMVSPPVLRLLACFLPLTQSGALVRPGVAQLPETGTHLC